MPDTVDINPPLPAAEIVHRIPGRMRLRVPAHQHDNAFFQRAEQTLAGITGIRRVRANPRTGSLLVEHDGIETAVLAAARDLGLFTAAPPARSMPVPHANPSTSKGAMLGASPLNLVALGLAGAGVMQLARGEVVGSASENLWNAYGLYAVTRQRWPLAFLVPFGLLQILRGEVLGSAISLFLYAFSARRMAQHRPVEDTV
jgi:hypothetical protein